MGYARSGFEKSLGCRMDEFSAVYVGGSDKVVNLARVNKYCRFLYHRIPHHQIPINDAK